MTMAGKNCRAALWRWYFNTDDSVGGADPTGSYVYNNIYAFIQEQPVEQLLLQQGLETQKVFQANMYPGWYVVHEDDELEIVAPTDHTYYGGRFRIINARHSSHNRRDPRGYIMLTMLRSVRTHDAQ